ncbi:hypothetical protein D3C72_1562660 [compost metagenome]
MAERHGQRLRRRAFRRARRHAHLRQQGGDDGREPCVIAVGGHPRGARQHAGIGRGKGRISHIRQLAGMDGGDVRSRVFQDGTRKVGIRGVAGQRHRGIHVADVVAAPVPAVRRTGQRQQGGIAQLRQQGQFAQGQRHRQQGVACLHGSIQPRQRLGASQARLQE